MPGRKTFIGSLGIAWLKEEPLDDAHLLGLWRSGWLFRSARPSYHVWIN